MIILEEFWMDINLKHIYQVVHQEAFFHLHLIIFHLIMELKN